VLAAGIKVSMDGRGRWLDNVFIERLWRSLKQEDIYLKGIVLLWRVPGSSPPIIASYWCCVALVGSWFSPRSACAAA
jgi:transposase InsO family protein